MGCSRPPPLSSHTLSHSTLGCQLQNTLWRGPLKHTNRLLQCKGWCTVRGNFHQDLQSGTRSLLGSHFQRRSQHLRYRWACKYRKNLLAHSSTNDQIGGKLSTDSNTYRRRHFGKCRHKLHRLSCLRINSNG